jgi:hypothetical protein
VRPERFELPTYCSGGNRSIHLSYGRAESITYARVSNGANDSTMGQSLDVQIPNAADGM